MGLKPGCRSKLRRGSTGLSVMLGGEVGEWEKDGDADDEALTVVVMLLGGIWSIEGWRFWGLCFFVILTSATQMLFLLSLMLLFVFAELCRFPSTSDNARSSSLSVTSVMLVLLLLPKPGT